MQVFILCYVIAIGCNFLLYANLIVSFTSLWNELFNRNYFWTLTFNEAANSVINYLLDEVLWDFWFILRERLYFPNYCGGQGTFRINAWTKSQGSMIHREREGIRSYLGVHLTSPSVLNRKSSYIRFAWRKMHNSKFTDTRNLPTAWKYGSRIPGEPKGNPTWETIKWSETWKLYKYDLHGKNWAFKIYSHIHE